MQTVSKENSIYSPLNVFNFVFFSVFGLLLFFTPATINGSNTIILDHLLTFINTVLPWFGPIFTLAAGFVGGIIQWRQKANRKGVLNITMTVLRTLGIPICFMAFFNIGPDWLMAPDMLPFLWIKVVVAVTMIVPIGSIFLTLIINYGCLEFFGVLFRPIMPRLFRTPGKSAIDAIASFVGSFSLAIYLTNKLYNAGKYTRREAFILISGFSTVSITFMTIVARTANLMEIWNFYFWSTMVICFLTTAIVVRLWPIKSISDDYIDGKGKPEAPSSNKSIWKEAVEEGLTAACQSGSIYRSIRENLKGSMKMVFVLTPSMTSIGLLSFILIHMTRVFDTIGVILLPFTYLISLIGIPEPQILAKAATAVLAEMFVPNTYVAGLAEASKYVIAVTSVASVLFFTGSIPCYLASDVKVPFWQVLVVWYQRTVICLILSGIVAALYF
ncbi:MAG: YjiH family protein [Tannerella sp.]|jgi:nucleoside recognition membrane protein YjiH|nr:YjiH family protein [Tannerella sp.]